MIELDFSSGCIVYLGFWLVTLAILWGRELWRSTAYQWQPTRHLLFRCEKCQHSFLERGDTNITRCPKCNSMCIYRSRKGL